jgi:hypothetical protein
VPFSRRATNTRLTLAPGAVQLHCDGDLTTVKFWTDQLHPLFSLMRRIAEPESPLGPLAANASTEGYGGSTQQTPQPFHGYLYRTLMRQGSHAQGGAKSYIVMGNMTGGFAILAYPAEYRNSGVMTFIINQEGMVLQKDLGADTAHIAKAIDAFDPDDTWNPVD